jgi:signal transduction histidine kinase
MIGSSLSIILAIILGNAIFNYYKMAEKEKEIRELSNSLLEVRDKEQTRIAADLDDEIVQNLLALKFMDNIYDMKEEIEHNIKLVRNIAFNLRPPELSDSLENSIRYFLTDIEEKTQIKTSLHFLCQKDYPFSQELEIMIYRLVYEAVNNSVKHSKATQIDVKVIPAFPNIIVRIEDNGIGFVYKNLQTQEHMGLKGMEGRVKTMNGVMKIKSELGKGTAIIFTIPDKRIVKIGKV